MVPALSGGRPWRSAKSRSLSTFSTTSTAIASSNSSPRRTSSSSLRRRVTWPTFGLDFSSLHARAPHLVMVSITPFGQTGPQAKAAATDLTVEAAGGLIALQGDGDRPPLPVGVPQASLHAGVQAAADALIALNARHLTGRGQHLDVSAQSAVVWTLMNATGWPSVVGRNPPGFCDTRNQPRPSPIPGMTPMRLFECKDGHATFGVHLPNIGERSMDAAVQWLKDDHPDLLTDDIASVDWRTWMSAARSGELDVEIFNAAYEAVAAGFKRLSKAELLDIAIERKMLIGPVLNTRDLFADKQLDAREFFREVGDLDGSRSVCTLVEDPNRVPHPGSCARRTSATAQRTACAAEIDWQRAARQACVRRTEGRRLCMGGCRSHHVESTRRSRRRSHSHRVEQTTGRAAHHRAI